MYIILLFKILQNIFIIFTLFWWKKSKKNAKESNLGRHSSGHSINFFDNDMQIHMKEKCNTCV